MNIVQRLREQGRVVDVLRRFLDRDIHADRTTAIPCPKHQANECKSPAAVAKPDVGGVECMSCGESWGLLDLGVLIGYAPTVPLVAVKLQQEFLGVFDREPRRKPKQSPEDFQRRAVHAMKALADGAGSWEPVADEWGLAPRALVEACGGVETDSEGRPAVFVLPVYDTLGAVVGLKERHAPTSDPRTKNFGSRGLLNAHRLDGMPEDGWVVLAEGETDMLALQERADAEGLPLVVVSASNGAGQQLRPLARLFEGRKLVVAYDEDGAEREEAVVIGSRNEAEQKKGRLHGARAAEELARVAAEVRRVRLEFTEAELAGGMKDLRDWLDRCGRRRTAADFLGLVTEAPPVAAAPDALDDDFDVLQFTPDDSGQAEFFARLHRDDVRCVHFGGGGRAERVWHRFDGNHWKPCTDGGLLLTKDAYRERARRIRGALAALTDDERKLLKAHADHARGLGSKSKRTAVLDLAAAEPGLLVPHEDLDRDDMLLGVRNGVLDLSTGKLRQGRPGDLITMSTAVPYDPNARAPRWELCLKEVWPGEPDLIDWLGRSLGYSLSGSVREQVFWTLFGGGGNGKDVVLGAMRYVMGDYGHTGSFSTFVRTRDRSSIPHDLADLNGRRFLAACEGDPGAEWDLPRLKVVTGGERIRAEKKHRDAFEFQSRVKLWFATNHLPRSRDRGHSFYRRLRVVPCRRVFREGERDLNLAAKLRDEAPGILAWLVRQHAEYLERGLSDVPKTVEDAGRDFREDNDPLGSFLAERVVETNHADVLPFKRLWQEYSNWCHGNQIDGADRLQHGTFAREMKARFEPRHVKMATGNGYRGLALRSAHEPVPEDT